ARHADFVLDLVVIRLQFAESERPVFDRRALWNSSGAVAALRLGDDLEVPRIQAPALRPIMQRGAADGVLHRVDDAARRWRGGCGRARRRDFVIRLLNALRPTAEI